MSDRATNIEMEDMLSSVKRLIKDGAAEAAPDTPVSADRLVLTDALRVAVPEDQPAHTPTSEDETRSLQEPASEAGPLEAAEPESEAETDNISPPPLFLRSQQNAEAASSLEATIAELEAAVGASDEEWEPDGSEMTVAAEEADDQNEPAEVAEKPPQTNNEVSELSPDAATDIWQGQTPEQEAQPAVASDEPQSAAKEVASLEDEITATATASMTAAVATEVSEALSGEVDAASAAAVAPEPQPASVAETEDTQPDAAEGDWVMDEDMLRAVVAEIVREELQGPLGERITRNVRKLVRREIYRILETRGAS